MDSQSGNVSELIRQARQGDPASRDELFRLCRSYLGLLARAQVGRSKRIRWLYVFD